MTNWSIADCDLDATIFGKETIFDFARHRRVEHYGRITSQTGVTLPPDVDSMVAPFQADFTTLPAQDRYKLLCALVVPRPIALVTTLGPSGIVNAAPFSFFNVFAEAPPLIVLGLQSRPDGSLKDTYRAYPGHRLVHCQSGG